MPVANPDLEHGEGRVDLLALLAFLPSVVSSFFTQNKPPPKFATACHCTKPGMWYKEKESLKLSTVLEKKKKTGKKIDKSVSYYSKLKGVLSSV